MDLTCESPQTTRRRYPIKDTFLTPTVVGRQLTLTARARHEQLAAHSVDEAWTTFVPCPEV
jgi:hypothetical protein